LIFYDAPTNVHGRQTLSLCRTVNPEEKRRIIGDMFVKEIDRTANDLNVTWDNLLLYALLNRIEIATSEEERHVLEERSRRNQYVATLLPIRIVGVKGDCRTYSYCVELSSDQTHQTGMV
ncbi:GMP synthase, partial [Daphnia magna]